MKAFPHGPDQLEPLDAERFASAAESALAAHALKVPMESPISRHFAIELEDGAAEDYRFSDTQVHRAAFAMRNHFASNNRQFLSAILRFAALLGIHDAPEMAHWIKAHAETGDHKVRIHPAVFAAAATLPLNADYEFDRELFFAHVAESAKGAGRTDSADSAGPSAP